MPALLVCLMLQFSIFLFFKKLGVSVRRRGLWTAAGLLLMIIPLSAGLFYAMELHAVRIPLPDLLAIGSSFFGVIACLGVLPATYLVSRFRTRNQQRAERVNASLEAEIAQRRKAEEELRALSLTDELTGLFNRRGLLTMGEHQLKLSRRTRRRLLVMYADLDNMKRINDKFGHVEGDAALIEAADILRQVFRESDIIARIGGDEFVILAVESNGAVSDALINRIHQRCILANLKKSRPYVLAMSAGAAEFDPDQPTTLEEIVAQADNAMYAEKQKRQKRAASKKPLKKQAELDLAYGSENIAS